MAEQPKEIRTQRAIYPVISETKHYVACSEPQPISVPLRRSELCFELEDLRSMGYRFIHATENPGQVIVLEKI